MYKHKCTTYHTVNTAVFINQSANHSAFQVFTEAILLSNVTIKQVQHLYTRQNKWLISVQECRHWSHGEIQML